MALGELEKLVMNVLWDAPETSWSVRTVADKFPDHAYTTIMTVLTRLASKGYLIEGKAGRANTYRVSATRESYVVTLMSEALATADDRAIVLARFAESMNSDDRAILSRLMRRK